LGSTIEVDETVVVVTLSVDAEASDEVAAEASADDAVSPSWPQAARLRSKSAPVRIKISIFFMFVGTSQLKALA